MKNWSRNRFCCHWELFGVISLDCKATRCDAGWTDFLWCQHCCDIPLLLILHNIRRVCLFLAQEVALFLVEALVISRLDHCGSCLAGVPTCSYPTLAAHPECCSMAGLQPTQVLLHCAALPHPALPTAGCLNPIENSDACLPWCAWLRSIQPPELLPAHQLHSATASRLASQSLRLGPSCCETKSWLLSVLAPQWWNRLSIDIRTAETLHTYSAHLFRRRLCHKNTYNTFLCLCF